MGLFSKYRAILGSFKLISPYIKKNKKVFGLASLLMLLIALMALPGPYIIKLIIDDALAKKNMKLLSSLILLLLLIQALNLLFSSFSTYFYEVFSQTALAQLKKDLIQRLLRLPLTYFSKSQTGYILSRIGEVDVLNVFLSSALARIFIGIFEFVFCLILLVYLNWQLALLSLSILPILAWATRFYARAIRKHSLEVMEKGAVLTHHVEEALSGVEIVKAFTAESRETSRIHLFLDDLRVANIKKSITLTFSSSLLAFIAAIGGYLVLLFSGIGIIHGSFTIGAYFAFSGYLSKLYGPTQTLANLGLSIQPGLTALERVEELFNYEVEKRGGLRVGQLKGEIEFRNVSFSYDNKFALKDINFKIEPGERVLITGPNGSGKSTIAKLLLGLYFPQEGEILIDGQRIEGISLLSLRDRISIVSQNTFLFNDSIRNNIAFSKPIAKAEEIRRAAELSGAADFVDLLPEGYETIVGENGKKLSGGERQKIAIARALLKEADILILDEVATHLDIRSLERLAYLLNEHFERKTCFLILHNTNYRLRIDRNIILDRGKIRAQNMSI